MHPYIHTEVLESGNYVTGNITLLKSAPFDVEKEDVEKEYEKIAYEARVIIVIRKDHLFLFCRLL